MTAEELIAALEQADGPSHELDGEIWCQTFAPDVVAIDPGVMFPSYTSSIDAALTLVPEGNWWEIKQTCAPNSPMRHFGSRSGLFRAETNANYGGSGLVGEHDIPAIALCIAALKARSASRRSGAVSERKD